jgi:hypothetical protein
MNNQRTIIQHSFHTLSIMITLSFLVVQGILLSTKPGTSLIILKPMKILQRDLNRCTFVAWEMKRNMSVVRLVFVTRSSGPPSSQPTCILPDTPLCLSLCHLTEGAYTIRLLFVSVVYSVSSHSWKMYRYTLEKRVFIVRTYWKTESIKLCQQQFLETFGGWHPPSKYCIWALSKKLETKGTL